MKSHTHYIPFGALRLSSVKVEVLGRNEENGQVTDDEGDEDTKVPPSVAEIISKRSVKLIADLVSAVLAHVGQVVANVPRSIASEEIAHV